MKGLPNRFFLMDQQDVFLRVQGFSHGRERRYEKVPTLDITKVIFYYALAHTYGNLHFENRDRIFMAKYYRASLFLENRLFSISHFGPRTHRYRTIES